MPVKALLRALEKDAREGRLVAVVRVLNPIGSSTMTAVVRPDGPFSGFSDEHVNGSVTAALRDMMRKGSEADLIEVSDAEGKPVRLVVELVRDKFHVVIFGGGHVGHAVALMSAILGYRVTVIDDREEFASRKRLPDPAINLMVSDYDTASKKLDLGANTAVVIVTRGHQYDEVCLRSVIRSDARYIGMIGSKRRVLGVFDRLNREGFTHEELGRVHAPIGLRIGGRSPQEIGVSIVAEIISHLNNSDSDSRGRNGI
jgi:xanthine/CO dehydrogenase XdhC/CoxF family maturation factor